VTYLFSYYSLLAGQARYSSSLTIVNFTNYPASHFFEHSRSSLITKASSSISSFISLLSLSKHLLFLWDTRHCNFPAQIHQVLFVSASINNDDHKEKQQEEHCSSCFKADAFNKDRKAL